MLHTTPFPVPALMVPCFPSTISPLAMGLDALDLLVVPWPAGTQGHRALSDRGERQRDGALFLKTWKALQRLVDAGTVRAVGRDPVCLTSTKTILQSNAVREWQLRHLSKFGRRLSAFDDVASHGLHSLAG